MGGQLFGPAHGGRATPQTDVDFTNPEEVRAEFARLKGLHSGALRRLQTLEQRWSDFDLESLSDVEGEFVEIPTPSNPAVNHVRLFARDNGSNIDLVLRSADGDECIICTLTNVPPSVAHTNTLTLNWVE